MHLETIDDLEQLLLIESANLLTMTPDPTQGALATNIAAAASSSS